MRNSVTYEDAKALLDEGFSVFPVLIHWNGEKFEKKPAVAWKEYQDRLPTDEELHGWFDNGNYNAIGLATGHVSGVVVVDVEKGGLEDAKGIDSERISNTISGGKHFFYEAPKEKIGNTVRIGGKQMDFRGDGGFVVVPPSFCDKDGQRYEYTWEKECPDFLLKPLPDLTGDWTEVKEPLKLDSLTHKGQGERNDSLYRSACSLLAKYDTDEAWRLVGDINRTYEPPLPDNEVRTLFQSAVNFIGKKSVEKEEGTGISLVNNLQNWADISEDRTKKEWIWENYVAKRNITVLTSLWKTGKSTFIRCLLKALAEEEEFVGEPTTKSKVLIISEEDLGQWAEHKAGDVGHVLVNSRPSVMGLSFNRWEEMIDETAKWCEDNEIDLFIMDTMSSFWPVKNENDASEVTRALRPFTSFTNKNIAVLLVHHERKSGGSDFTAIRGSGAFPAFVDNIVEFKINKDGLPNQRILKVGGRFDNNSQVVIEFTNEEKYIVKGEPWQVSKKARLGKIVSICKLEGVPLSVPDLFRIWTTSVGDVTKRSIRAYVKELVDKGMLRKAREETIDKQVVPYYEATGYVEAGSKEQEGILWSE